MRKAFFTVFLISAGCNDVTDEYMIFHTVQYIFAKDSSTDPEGDGAAQVSGSGWYKIPAKAGETELEALTGYDTQDELVTAEGDPKSYADQFTNLYPFGFYEMAHSSDDFTNSNVLTLP